jgi:hypothetical protein
VAQYSLMVEVVKIWSEKGNLSKWEEAVPLQQDPGIVRRSQTRCRSVSQQLGTLPGTRMGKFEDNLLWTVIPRLFRGGGPLSQTILILMIWMHAGCVVVEAHALKWPGVDHPGWRVQRGVHSTTL